MTSPSDVARGPLRLFGSLFARKQPTTQTMKTGRPYLEIEPPDGTQVRSVPLTAPSLCIGRDSGNDLQLEGTAVGHFQCELVSNKNKWYVRRSSRDTRQTNPMFLRYASVENDDAHGTRLVVAQQLAELSDGDTIYFFAEPDQARWFLHFRDPNSTQAIDGFPHLELARETGSVWMKDGRLRKHLNLAKQLRTLLFAMYDLNHENKDEPTVCSYEYLIGKIWGYSPDGGAEMNVRALIKTIRAEIDRARGIDGEGERFIEMVLGEGYRLVTDPGPRPAGTTNPRRSRRDTPSDPR